MSNGVTKLDRNTFKPLYAQLAEAILDYARDNHLKHGDKLPSENKLLSQFDVSRNTIRLAVDRLVQLGAAKKVRGQGTFFIKEKKSLSVKYHHAFEGSVERIGLKFTNKLIDQKKVTGHMRWIDGLRKTHWDETIWIRRLKLGDGELLAIEERLIPGYVAKRLSQKDIDSSKIFPDLLDQHADTKTTRFNYTFASHPLSEEESKLANLPQGMYCLRRIGEYYNSVGERFMLSRMTIISDRINLKFEFVQQDGNWIL